MSRWGRWIAALLPLIGLALIWARSEQQSREGTLWDVPIVLFALEDQLLGHYLEYQYDWPGFEKTEDVPPEFLCLSGKAPRLARVRAMRDDAARARCSRHFVRAQPGSVFGERSLTNGRIYISEERARVLAPRLREGLQRGTIRIRQRPDGQIIPLALKLDPPTPDE